MLSKRKMAAMIGALSLTMTVTACSFGGAENKASDEPTSLKVMYYDENQFYREYGMLFSALHPNVDIQVAELERLYRGKDVTDYNQAILDFIEEEQPDILMLQPEQYKELAHDGRLYDLDKLVSDEDFDLEGILPGFVDYLKDMSGGKLYGLTPTFYSQAIYYNKDLFEQYGVPLPTDQMTWEELLDLAMRFPTDGGEDRVYGLSMGYRNTVFDLGNTIGATQGLSFVDPEQMKVTINTDTWKAVFQQAVEALQSGALYSENPDGMMHGDTYEDYLMQDPFISGRLAMLFEGSYKMDELRNAKDHLQDRGIQNWDLVTVPVDPNNPDASTSVQLNQIFAISASSPNIPAAEQFVSYIHGAEFARVNAKAQMGSFPIRSEYIADEEGRNMQAFTKLKPSQNQLYADYEKIPQQFFMEFDGLSRQAFDAVLRNEQPLDDALNKLQTNLQDALIRAEQAEEEQGKTDEQATEAVVEESLTQ